jgi:NADPH-ferrihemoprotein reductase
MDAKRICEVGRVDEAKGGMATEEDFMDWKEMALESMATKVGVEEGVVGYVPGVEIVPARSEPEADALTDSQEAMRGSNGAFESSIVVAKDLVHAYDRKCIHLEFDLAKISRNEVSDRDHLAVWPINPDDEVQRLCQLLGLDEETRTELVVVKSTTEGRQLSNPATRRKFPKHHLNICGPVSRDFLRHLVAYCPTGGATNMISGWVKNRTLFQKDITERHLSISKVMQVAWGDLVWGSLPFTLLVEFLGKLQPRYYSIASSPSLSPHQPAVRVAIASKIFDKDSRFQ